MAVTRCGACVAMVGLLVSCGGGGGGGGGGTITVMWDQPSWDETFLLPTTFVPVSVSGSLTGAPGGTIYANLTINADGTSPFPDQDFTIVGTSRNFFVDLVVDSGLAAGTYTGTVSLVLCKDAACNSKYGVTGNTIPYVIRLIDSAGDECQVGTVTTLGPYLAENAVSSGQGTQCATATSNAAGGIDGFLLAQGRAFPRVVYGQTPQGSPVTGADLPAQLSALDSVSVHAEASERYTSDYVGRVALDLWLVSDTTPVGGSMPIVGEVQIAICQNPIDVDTSSCRSVTSLGGYSWKACALTGTTWPGIIYYLPTPRAWVTLDVVPFLNDFRTHEGQAITGSPYLPAVAFGDVVEQGYTENVLTGFKVTVVKH